MKQDFITYFTTDEIEEIKNYLANYAVAIYENTGLITDEVFKSKYEKALKLMKTDLKKDISELKAYLDEKQQKFDNNLKMNEVSATITSMNIRRLFIEKALYHECYGIEKVNYVFDFITSYFKYSYDYVNYNSLIPNMYGNYTFDFKGTLPVKHDSLAEMLAYGQAQCEEISNLMSFLGKTLDTDIKVEFAVNNGISHALNSTIIDDQFSYIDATKFITGKLKKDECFLVSKDVLSKKETYEIENEDESYTIDNPLILPYNMSDISKEVKSLLPAIEHQKYDVVSRRI